MASATVVASAATTLRDDASIMTRRRQQARDDGRRGDAMLSVQTTYSPSLTKISSWHPKGVKRAFFDKKLDLCKASFRLYGIKHQINGNHLYYFRALQLLVF